MRLSLLVAALLLGLGLAASPGARAASFNCKKASTDTEHAICANGKLSALDSQMAKLYKAVLKAVGQSGQRDSVIADQQYWLSQRDDCGGLVDCLKGVYTARIGELTDMLQAARSAG